MKRRRRAGPCVWNQITVTDTPGKQRSSRRMTRLFTLAAPQRMCVAKMCGLISARQVTIIDRIYDARMRRSPALAHGPPTHIKRCPPSSPLLSFLPHHLSWEHTSSRPAEESSRRIALRKSYVSYRKPPAFLLLFLVLLHNPLSVHS